MLGMIEKNNIAAAGVISAFGSRIRLGGHNLIFPSRTCNCCSSIRLVSYPDPRVGGGKAGLISEPTLYLLGLIL